MVYFKKNETIKTGDKMQYKSKNKISIMLVENP